MYGLGIAKGMVLTLKSIFLKPFTIQYPEEKLPQSRRFRGFEFTWYVERCTVCASCAKACPHGVIRIVSRQEGSRYVADVFEIDTGICMFCGLCVEACPYDAIRMGSAFEVAPPHRKRLILQKEDLMAQPQCSSAYARPKRAVPVWGPLVAQPGEEVTEPDLEIVR